MSPPLELQGRVGARVRARRTELKLTRQVLADRSGLSLRFVAQLEKGEANISIGKLDGVARALGLSLAQLVAESTAPLSRIHELLANRPPAELERCYRVLQLTLGESQRHAVALLGLRGAGKSTLGVRAADHLDMPFVELDTRIEDAAGLNLTEIFSLHGEGYYRRLEGGCVAELLSAGSPCVVALPGGIVHNEEAFRLVRRHATTVWLKAAPEDHMARVLAQGDRRPMDQSQDAMAELRAILAAREPLYQQADVGVDTSAQGEAESLRLLLSGLEGSGWARGPAL